MIAMIELGETGQLTVAGIVGVALGFMLVAGDLCNRESILSALQLKNGRVINTILTTLFLGILYFYAAVQWELIDSIQVHASYFWAAIGGGVLCGVGLFLTSLTPVSAVAALGSGRMYALWVLCGMALALPFTQKISRILSKTLFQWDISLGRPAMPKAFFVPDNPALYLLGALLIIIALVIFTIGNKEK